jgi:uncharacterized coiled-coil protein SlyX
MTRRRSTRPDRSALQQLLAETEERIAHGEEQIAAQRKLIAELNATAMHVGLPMPKTYWQA